MKEVRCWRCDKKLAVAETDAHGVTIACHRCGVKNVIGKEPRVGVTPIQAGAG